MADEPYRIERTRQFDEGLARLQPGHVDRVMAFLRDHVRFRPARPIPGSLKELRGDWAGHWQFMVSARHGTRLIYTVDEERRTVTLLYLGAHPDWSASRRGQHL